MSSVVTLAKALYSASVLDQDTVAYFLELHEIKLGPKNTTNCPIDLLSFGHPAQSAHENPLRTMDDDRTNFKPCGSVPLTYLKILLTLF
jgi:hypothetical protein